MNESLLQRKYVLVFICSNAIKNEMDIFLFSDLWNTHISFQGHWQSYQSYELVLLPEARSSADPTYEMNTPTKAESPRLK